MPPVAEMPTGPANEVPLTKIARDGTVTLTLDAKLPPATHVNPEAPMLVKVRDGQRIVAQKTIRGGKLPVTLELAAADIPDKGALDVTWPLAYCGDGNMSQCVPLRLSWRASVERTEGERGGLV